MADASEEVSEFRFTFKELFWQVWQDLKYSLHIETDYCLMFELMTHYNRIVVRQNSNKLVLY